MPTNPKLLAFYLSRDRVLSLLQPESLSANVLGALQGLDVPMASGLLSGAVGGYLLEAIRSGHVKTLHQLTFEGNLISGTPFVYDGHFYGKGFAYSNKTPALALTEKLDGPLEGKTLVFEFSKSGLVNDTAYTRMSGSTKLFAFGYVTEIVGDVIRAAPYVVGDLVEATSPLQMAFAPSLELRPEQIEQFSRVDTSWLPSMKELRKLRDVPERAVKELICRLLGEYEVPADWGGEEADMFSANLVVDGRRNSGAFLLKGPAAFHTMTMKDCGKNGDQIYRLFNIPASIYVVQHCHHIGAAVRKTVEAFALGRAFTAPCKYVLMDGVATARLLRAHGAV